MRSFLTITLLCAVTAGVAVTGCGKKKESSGDTGGSGGNAGASGAAGSGAATCAELLNDTTCGKCIEANCCPETLECVHDAECQDCLTNTMADPMVCAMNAQVNALVMCQQASCTKECKPPSCARFCCADSDCGTGTCKLGVLGSFPKLGVCKDAQNAVACDAPAMSMTMGSCFTVDATNVCNPVTNEGCDSATGAACDLEGEKDVFVCFPSGNTQTLCQDCNNASGPFCAGTFHCTPQDE